MAPTLRTVSASARSLPRSPRPAGARTRAARLGNDPLRSPAILPSALPAASPIIKWVGGKTRLLGELTARAPQKIERYYEAFAGGAALFFRLAPARAVINDGNRDLVGMYRAVAADPDAIIRRLEIHRKLHGESHYYETRARWNDAGVSWTALDRAATFIYLNKTCFNGLWRVNRSGHFNVPMGRYEDPPICNADALRLAGQAMANVDFRVGDFRVAVKDAAKGDFVYFDPPYDPATPTSNFTSYTVDAFGQDAQRDLAELAHELIGRGCKVMLSNNDTPFVRSLYKGLTIDRVKCGRAINSNAAKRGDVDEVIAYG